MKNKTGLSSTKLALIFALLIIMFLSIFITCEDRDWKNPCDAKTTLNPSEWAPSKLQIEQPSVSQIKLTWQPTKYEIDGYKVERKEEGGSYSEIADLYSNTATYTDQGLSQDILYTYRVAAYTSQHTSGYCDPKEIMIVTDIDGNTYQTVKIGDQWWMAENLKVTHYRNGDAIPNVTDNTEWENLTTGAYCNYNNNSSNAATYGRLYNWYAVSDSRQIAPAGWHIPSDAEWKTLEMYLGMSQSEADGSVRWRGTDEGGKLKETGTSHWRSPNTGATNESGFSALPGGYRLYWGTYFIMGGNAAFWSSTEYDSYGAWFRGLSYDKSDVYRRSYGKEYGFSVRCVRD